jgi:hypothetical protein
MKRIQITKPTRKREQPTLDPRTPSGRTLPY